MHELSIGMAALALVDCKLYSMAASLAIMLLLSQSSGDKISMESSFHESSNINQVEVVLARQRRQPTPYIGTDSPTGSTVDYTSVSEEHGEDEEGGEDGGPGDDGGPGEDEEGPGEDEEPDNEEEESCTEPRQPQPKYNNSCEYIHSECKGKTKLVNYLSLVVCDLRVAQVANFTHCCTIMHVIHRTTIEIIVALWSLIFSFSACRLCTVDSVACVPHLSACNHSKLSPLACR